MVEQIKRKPGWSSYSRFEQLALIGTILVWGGVVLFAVGLCIAFRNYNIEQIAYAEATAMAPEDTETVTPSPTPLIFPAGWSTATPTVTPIASPTRPTQTALRLRTEAPPTRQTDPRPTPPQPTPTVHAVPPASQPPDRVAIPAIGLDIPIVPIGWHVVKENGQQYSVWQVADYVAGWHNTSAYPGHRGNIVLNGHHNIKGEVFRYLVDLDVGNRIHVYVQDQVYHYAVSEKHILKEKGEPPEVRRQNATWIAPTDYERLTLVTCWPYTDNTHRLVVVAKPVPAPPKEELIQ